MSNKGPDEPVGDMGFQHPDFTSKDDPQTLIVYGLFGDPARVLAQLVAARQNFPPLANRYAVISSSTRDIRLSSPGWMHIDLNQRLALVTSEELFVVCRERLLKNTPPFSGPTRLFLNHYLEFVKDEVASKRQTLIPFQPETEVFTYQDFAFSAWLPLPEARILLPPDFDDDGPAFAEVNLAFWQRGRIVAILIEGTGTPVKSRRRKLDFLRKNHPYLELVRVQKDQLRSGAFPIDRFPESFARFWEGVDLPIGPCPPTIEMANKTGNDSVG